MALNRDDILKIDDKQRKTIAIPEWGGDIIIQTLAASEQVEFEKAALLKDNNHVFVLIQYSCVDESGNKLFESIEEVKSMATKPLIYIFTECLKLTTVTTEELENKAKNS